MARCALVNASISDVNSLPLGVLWLAANLRASGHEVTIADYQLAQGSLPDPRNLKRFCLDLNCDIVGLSVTCASLPTALTAVELIKKETPDMTVIMGGPGVCDRPLSIVNAYPVDYIVVGEGEVAASLLLSAIERGDAYIDIPGVVYRDDDGIVHSRASERITDLDRLTVPDYDEIDFSLYGHVAAVVTRRGCPFSCRFCSARSVWGSKVVSRSADGVIDEIRALAGRVSTIEFHDDTFAALGQGEAIMKELRSNGIDLPWGCNCRADMMSPELGERLAALGCVRVLIGVESGSDRVLGEIGKGVTAEQCQNAVFIAADTIGSVTTSYIWGFASETVDDLSDTLMMIAADSRRDGVCPQFGLLSPLPGSPIGKIAKNLSFSTDLNPGGLIPQNYRLDDFPAVVEAIVKHREIFQAHYYIDHPEFSVKRDLVQRFLSLNGGQ